MPAAPRPLTESERLNALDQYQVLNTPPEQIYDDLAQLASQICGTPMAAITLIGDRHQWLKARIGLDDPETSRDVAMCAYTILGPDTLVVPDAHDDARFSDNPYVLADPFIRFYAGAPLTGVGGQRLGSVCVMDRRPRQLSPDQRHALEVLARQTVAHLELRRVTRLLADALERTRLLSGLLPICAYCKKVRDDQEYWREVESYIRERAPVEFSHGICPDCVAKHFPDTE